jgi:hypothetical protein
MFEKFFIPFMCIFQIVYMDHLDFPPNEHIIDYLLPRACHVTNSDFAFVVANGLDRKILNNKTVFGRHPVRRYPWSFFFFGFWPVLCKWLLGLSVFFFS